MESNFDLDVNNYTTDDLIHFFKLDNNMFSHEDLIKKEEEKTIEILSINNSKYNSKYKFDIINFIKSAKDVLISSRNDIETNKEIQKNIDKFIDTDKYTKVGKIINPFSHHQSLENTKIPNYDVNGYNYNTTTSIYVFNTIARNNFYTTVPSNSTYDLPVRWKDVISISLSSASIPNVMYAYNNDSETNQIYIEEDNTGLSAIVTLPEGNYTPYDANLIEASFTDALTQALNQQVLGIIDPSNYRFNVYINLANHKTTISNTTNTFTMRVLNKVPFNKCSIYSNDNYINNILNKSELQVHSYVETMGYLMGYRELEYSNNTSYISESIFTNIYSNYLYFALEDYTSSQTVSNTYGILGENGMLDSNILAVIPINSNLFTTTFDNYANYIYKKREYFGPVDISKISIKLINQKGNLVNLNGTEFNFSLKVKTIYNLTQKDTPIY